MPHYAMIVIVEAPDSDMAYDTVANQLCPEAEKHLAEYVSAPWGVEPDLKYPWSAADAIDWR